MVADQAPRNGRVPRNRSRLVCHRCHARKVKCDLFLRLQKGGTCTNCEKRAEPCQRREHKKAQSECIPPSQAPTQTDLSPQRGLGTTPPDLSFIDGTAGPGGVGQSAHTTPSANLTSAASDNLGYIGEFSVFSNHRPLPSEASTVVGSFARSIEEQTLAATGADQLPAQSKIVALTGAYFKYLYHRIPVVNHQDVAPTCPSTLLLQSLCLAGSILRHPKSTKSLVESEQFYSRAKTLFYTNHERDPITILKALCLLTLWNVTPPAVVTIDNSWNWLGLAIRFAFQIGLHREPTYSQRSAPGCARRIAWFLYAQDKLHAACFGRPQMIKSQDFDLCPPRVTDFENPENGQARLFVLYAKLTTILEKMLPLQNRGVSTSSDEALSVLSDLKDWVTNIPPDIRLFDDQGNRVYERGFYEILTWYFTCIITFFHVHGRLFHPSATSTITLVASSCTIRLYQEMDYRDDINYLMSVNNWSMMVASLPQLSSLRNENLGINSGDKDWPPDPLSLEELDILLEILTQRILKFPGAKAIVERILRCKAEVLSHGGLLNPLTGLEDTSRASWDPTWRTYTTVPRVYELFPFKKELSPRMELLSTMETEDFTNGLFESFTDWSIENLLNLDILNSFV
ncbi:hypothetical protein N7474_000885 [Penicillium riverlandense]|uniref:uncharacterized protein n=1 Tax=Penicillium riverlandense TaxID=1903569 RepID=UPI00254894BE|nr:uncharacterized protein N7474_000885 [Penicillium riverlandense]KAJ5832574.1 hypothetical protein N7474_000885 [Penicillium riverlandense]